MTILLNPTAMITLSYINSTVSGYGKCEMCEYRCLGDKMVTYDDCVKLVVTAELTQLFAVWTEVCTGDSVFMPLEVSLQGWILLQQHGTVSQVNSAFPLQFQLEQGSATFSRPRTPN